MKISSSPRELAGCYDVRKVLGERGKSLVFRADETVVRRGNDVNGAIARSACGWAFDSNLGRLQFERAWRKTRTSSKPSAPGPTCTKNKDRINDALKDWEILRSLQSISRSDLRG